MIHPSYTELMKEINSKAQDETEVIHSRYSIVIAAAKRARQLIAGAEPFCETTEDEKPLSVAVEELYSGDVNIIQDPEYINEDDPAIEAI